MVRPLDRDHAWKRLDRLLDKLANMEAWQDHRAVREVMRTLEDDYVTTQENLDRAEQLLDLDIRKKLRKESVR